MIYHLSLSDFKDESINDFCAVTLTLSSSGPAGVEICNNVSFFLSRLLFARNGRHE